MRDERIDWVDLTWTECTQRALRKQTRAGLDVRIVLKLGITLRHADILWRDPTGACEIVVNVLPCDVLLIRPRDPSETATLLYKLGDHHGPVQINNDEIVTLDDGPILAILDELKLPYESQSRRFEPTLRSSETVTLSPDFSISRRR